MFWFRIAVLCLVLFPSSVFSADLRLAFADDSVTVLGSAPGGEVALFAAGRKLSETGIPVLERLVAQQADTDRDGETTFRSEWGVPRRSVWVAVDLSTGAWAAARPTGLPEPLATTPVMESTGFAVRLRRAWTLWVRPGTGVWLHLAADGGPDDADGEPDAVVSLGLGAFTDLDPREPLAPPGRVEKDDRLFVIDPDTLRFGTLYVASGR